MRDIGSLWRDYGFVGMIERAWGTAFRWMASWRLTSLLGRIRNLWRLPGVRKRHQGGWLNLGCGKDRRSGFVNADLGLIGDVHVDVRRRFPFANEMFSLIYTESMLEHVDTAGGLNCLRECHRVLARGGILRLGMPDLAYYVACYRDPAGLGAMCPPLAIPDKYKGVEQLTPAQTLQLLFYQYGHRHLYDREELDRLLRAAGFAEIACFAPGVGSCELTTGLELRQAGLMVVEATKHGAGGA